MSETISKALRNRKTLIQNLSTHTNRINQNAITYGDKIPDYSIEDLLNKFDSDQSALRKNKIDVIKKSVEATVKIPEGFDFPESGQFIPVYQAVLLRDDLKAKRKIIVDLTSKSSEGKEIFDRATADYVTIPAVRHYDLNEFDLLSEKLQDVIDEIDAAIQYVDATEKI